MSYKIQIDAYGDTGVLQAVESEVEQPGPNEVCLRQTAVGLNFIDIYERTGLYKSNLPLVLGREAAGLVVAVGDKVSGLKVGDRVAYTMNFAGAYTHFRNVATDSVVKLPKSIGDEVAAAIMLKGLTAYYLLRQSYPVRKGDFIVIHAAAGGVGLLLTQWAKHLGAIVIAVVSTTHKAALAEQHGAMHVLLDTDDWVNAARAITNGVGVTAVYDSVGEATFIRSLDCLKPRGMMISFGNSSGPVPPIAPSELGKRGSLFLTRPSLFHYIATRAELQRAARELFAIVKSGVVKVHIGQRYPLKEAARAHQDIEARKTVGATILVP
jgi:NADPH:quinone reductase